MQPKVKLFIWRACKNIFPTQTNLFGRGVSQNGGLAKIFFLLKPIFLIEEFLKITLVDGV
jgi:hypothetical protein